LQDSARDTSAFTQTLRGQLESIRQSNHVTETQMRKFLRDAAGDFDKANASAARFNDTVRGIQGSIVRMRAAAAQRGDIIHAGKIASADPFQNSGAAGSIIAGTAAQGISRTQAALFSVVFTLGNLGEQIAAADTKWQKLDRTIGTALQTIASVAVFYGPAGILVAAVAATGNFLSSFWTQQREEAERTAREMEEHFKRLRKGGIGNAAEAAQELFSGAGGVQDLQRQLDEAIARRGGLITSQAGRRTSVPEQRELRNAFEEVTRLQGALAAVQAQHQRTIGIVNELATVEGNRAAAALSIARGQAAQKRVESEPQELLAQAGALLRLQTELTSQRQYAVDIDERLLTIYGRLNELLGAMRDKTSTAAAALRSMISDLERHPIVAAMTGNAARPEIGRGAGRIVQDAVSSRQITGPINIAIPELKALPQTMAQKFALAIRPFVDALEQMSGYLLNWGIGLLSQFGGAGGQFIGGIAQGAMAGFQMAGPMGAAIGGVTGLVSGLLSLGQSSREARAEMERWQQAYRNTINDLKVQVGLMSASQRDAELIRQQFDTLRDQLRDSYRMQDLVLPGPKLDEYNRRLAELNELEKLRLEQLEKEAAGLNSMTEAAEAFRNVPSWFKVNLEVWRAANRMFDVDPANNPRRPNDPRRPTNTTTMQPGGQQVFQIGNIQLNSRATNGAQLVDEFLAELRRRGLAIAGMGNESIILGTL
jgi:hypothetical protein